MKEYHLSKENDTWKLKERDAARAVKVFADMNKVEATRAAGEFVRTKADPKSVVMVHGIDGKIVDKYTYSASGRSDLRKKVIAASGKSSEVAPLFVIIEKEKPVLYDEDDIEEIDRTSAALLRQNAK